MPNVLLISDDEAFAADLAGQITGYASDFAVLKKDSAISPDIVVIDGFAAPALSFAERKVPVFVLSSEAAEAEIPAGCRLIAKPFVLAAFLDELRACINLFENSAEGYIEFNNYTVRPIKKEILNHRNNEVVKLTEKEVAMLRHLYKNKDRIVGKNELLQEVWGYAPDASTHTIETHIYRLRQKVEHDDAAAQLILTVDGGYQLKI